MENNDFAIRLTDVKKVYKLYNKPKDRLFDAFGLLRGKRKPALNYALKGVDLEIKKGETVGIIGTNGSGKSTILKIITGVLFETSGEVEINGRISALLELGAGFNMEYTGVENVYLNATMMGFSDEEIEKKTSGDLRVCGHRRLCISAGKDLLQRYVCPPCICGCHKYRSRDIDRG